MESTARGIVVLGIGNVLWADEGFGVRVLERLNALWAAPAGVRFIDGGTQGLALLPIVQSAQKLIVVDAVDFGLPPSELIELEGQDVPATLQARKMSLHQMGFSDVLACASLLGTYPQELVLIGVQPCELDDFGGSLRAPVRLRVDEAVARVCKRLRDWGIALEPQKGGAAPLLCSAALELGRYESERPSQSQACRSGDERFWQQGALAQD